MSIAIEATASVLNAPAPAGPGTFERESWTLSRNLPTLCQEAGVHIGMLRRVVVKELVDNALDACGACRLGELPGGGYVVEDDGPGIGGIADEVGGLFSIRRPLASSKLLRRPSRGALGNGLRVVTGAVLGSGGRLSVRTGGRWVHLCPQDDGTTAATEGAADPAPGTRVEVRLGPALPEDPHALSWGRRAIELAAGGTSYKGKPSPHWYDDDSFFELCRASGQRSPRELVCELDGCTGSRAGEIARPFKGLLASALSRHQASELLSRAREASKPVKPVRLGRIGPDHPSLSPAYAARFGTFRMPSGRGGTAAELPFVVEAWVERAAEDGVEVFVNRTPITGTVSVTRQKERTDLGLFGCGLKHRFTVGRPPVRLYLHVVAPYVPIISNGKNPDLRPFIAEITHAVEQAARKARRYGPAKARANTRELVEEYLDEAVAFTSGGGSNRYSQRQVYYTVRKIFAEKHPGVEVGWKWFCQILTLAESDREIPGMYRDVRGILYHPHLGTEIPLGTLAVEEYERPKWTFNKILYCEKEGLFPLLRSVKWPERHDCALMSAKGFATRAAKDVLDLLSSTGEEVTFFCVHDADGPGTLIYESLQGATGARGARKAKVINLGLDPWEAVGMGLQVESFKAANGRAVASYVSERDERDGEDWTDWLQTHRVELNAMSFPQFLDWLDRKIAPHSSGKVVPPAVVLRAEFEDRLREGIRENLTAQAILEARVEERTAQTIRENRADLASAVASLESMVRTELQKSPADDWRQSIVAKAAEMVSGACRRGEGRAP